MNEDQGAIACGLVDTELFEPPYDDVAKRAIAFRKKFGHAPGEAHLDDLFDHILSDNKNKRHRLYTQVLGNIIEQSKGLNAKFVLSKTSDFMRGQTLKLSVLEAAERYQKGGDELIPDVENILHKALKSRSVQLNAGVRLSDAKLIGSFLARATGADYYLGIPALDHRGIGPTRGEALGFMAPPKRGKTWFCVNTGVEVWKQGGKVLHASLEMKDERVVPRYMQRMFAIAKRNDAYERSQFEMKNKRIVDITTKKHRPRLWLSDENIEKKIADRLKKFGARLDRIIVKSFPTGSLTTGALNAYLDGLALTEDFVPDVLILDYPKLMKLDRRQDLRIALGLQVEELRGLCMERNMCGVFPFQGNRQSEKAVRLTGQHMGEDYSINQTVDMLLTYSQTAQEKKRSLGRLYVEYARNDEDGFEILMAQDYVTGQFCLQSAYMPKDYHEMIRQDADSE